MHMNRGNVEYRLDEDGRFHIENYNCAEAHSNFFPGVAGPWGVPMWVYYVNRGQAIASFGLGDKDGQILPFESFNLACNHVTWRGFRTFVRINKKKLYEPFRKTGDKRIVQRMIQDTGELIIEDENRSLGLVTNVLYFTLPEFSHGLFVRILTLKNISKSTIFCELLDGAARIIPHGTGYQRSVFIARHIEAMMGVRFAEGGALYRLNQTADDVERVESISGGNFYLPSLDGKRLKKGLIADPDVVFGGSMSYERAWVFEEGGLEKVLGLKQMADCKTPCGFAGVSQEIGSGEEIRLVSVLGNVERDEDLLFVRKSIGTKGFLEKKREENRALLARIENHCFTVSERAEFDAYSGRNFLDNVLRGGLPVVVHTGGGKRAYYMYSRQNGDLERDYHWFVLQPSYLSQGTGHYRSILQNRRCDTWFFPQIEDDNLFLFMNLVQLDGYNPLEVRSLEFRFGDPGSAAGWVEDLLSKAGCVEGKPGGESFVSHASFKDELERISARLAEGYYPGEVILELERFCNRVLSGKAKRTKVDGWFLRKDVFADLMKRSVLCETGALHEGFWVDHWTYNLDLLDFFLAVYPDKLFEVLFGRNDYTFFDNPDVVLPRSAKTVLRDDGAVRRYGAVIRDSEKIRIMEGRKESRFRARIKKGSKKGEIYRTNLFVKFLVIAVNRAATLDPFGRGLEMEADKPGWNDSMNGLPALFGSSTNETLELLRCVRFLKKGLGELGTRRGRGPRDMDGVDSVKLFIELNDFMESMIPLLSTFLKRGTGKAESGSALRYWAKANELKEKYREAVRLGVGGKEVKVDSTRILKFLELCEKNLERIFEPGRESVVSPEGVPYTYFVNEVTKWNATQFESAGGLTIVEPSGWKQRPVRLFLEGPVHYMKVFPQRAAEVHAAVRKSPLFDRKLKMYKNCVNMQGEDPELGRAVGAYPRGWIENESIYLHMEYKYLLEMLRAGLCKEFFNDMENAVTAFMDPQVYGRNPLEGASFLVSSAFADPRHHGRAFQPRLSGITCEFVHAWTIMTAGPEPFGVTEDGELYLALKPRLAGRLFTTRETTRKYIDPVDGPERIRFRKGAFAFKFLGRSLVVYTNEKRKDTFGPMGCRVSEYTLHYRDGRRQTVCSGRITGSAAHSVRSGEVKRLDAVLS